MKKALLFLLFLLATAWISYAASDPSLPGREHESYVDTGVEKHCKITLGANVNQVSTVTFTSEFKGFRIYPSTYNVEFSIQLGETSRTVVTSSNPSAGVVIGTTTYVTGGWAVANMWETRLLPSARDLVRRLYIMSINGSVEILFEAF